ncbi:MAG TPA: rhodanese-like domain-containing protein [Leucothrix mucor]|nr:rhodanese-like domain-containing protein [Leucothrix mucor]
MKVRTLFKFFILAVTSGLLLIPAYSYAENKVGITKDVNSLDITYGGKTVTIERIQNSKNKLTNGFAKTSRACPPFCVQPMEIHEGVKTVGEAELLSFLDEEVKNGKGLLIDARLPDWFEKGTIPGSINIPFSILDGGLESEHTRRILKLLGATETDSKWDFENAQELLLFCNGLWCGQSPRAIGNLIDMGYPAEKLFWYRGGMQSWLLLGLTVVTP